MKKLETFSARHISHESVKSSLMSPSSEESVAQNERPQLVRYFGAVNSKFLEALTSNPHCFYFCSEGGSCDIMSAAIDYLDMALDNITLVATGCCMSAAVAILASGGQKFCTPNTRFMVHLPWQISQEQQTIETLSVDKRELTLSYSLILKTLTKRTKQTKKWWEKRIREGFWFGAADAKRIGLVEDVL